MVARDESYRINQRIKRLNALGFDVSELAISTEEGGRKLRFGTHVVEPGHHQRRLFELTGLRVQENQARALLADLARFRAKWIEGAGLEPGDVPEDLAARRWLDEKFYGTLALVPAALRAKLPDAELFFEISEHRWFLSEAAGARRRAGGRRAVLRRQRAELPAGCEGRGADRPADRGVPGRSRPDPGAREARPRARFCP